MATTNQTIEKISRKIAYIIEAGQEAAKKFATRLAEDPMYAFEWQEGAVEAIARAEVAAEMAIALSAIQAGRCTAAEALETLDRTADSKIRDAHNLSTSAGANLVRRMRSKAWVDGFGGDFGCRRYFVELVKTTS